MTESKRIYACISCMVVFFLCAFVINGQEIKTAPLCKKGEKAFAADEVVVKFAGDRKPFRILKVPPGQVGKKVKELKKKKHVVFAEPNYLLYALNETWIPNDPYYSYQWHFRGSDSGGVRMPEAWGFLGSPGLPGKNIVVAVVDTGVAYENYRSGPYIFEKAEDLQGTDFVAGYDVVNNDTHPNDDRSPGHGTHVTGTIAQSTDNGIGVAGIAFNCSIMPVKVLDKNGSGTSGDVAEGIRWAVDHGADVINLSLGGSSPSLVIEEAVEYAYDHNVTVVAAAGNSGIGQLDYPAAYNMYVIAVGATQYDKSLAPYSSFGPGLDIVAPGGNTGVDQNGDGYADGVLQQTFEKPNPRSTVWDYYFFQGTSMATPHVSAVAALLLSCGNAATPDDVREAIQSSALDLGDTGPDETFGYGLLDVYAALQWNKGPVDNPPAVSITAPADGGAVAGTITVTAEASDDNGVVCVNFYADGFSIGSDDTAPYSVSFDTTTVSEGNCEITAEAVDTVSQTAADIITVFVDNVNDAPVADAGTDQDVYTNASVILDGSGSYDPDGEIVSYEWILSDGSVQNNITASIVYAAAGTYTETLNVTDDRGAVSQDTVTVTVTDEPSVPDAWLVIHMGSHTVGRKFWKGTAQVTVTENDGSGRAIANATVEGAWSGADSAAVSGLTDAGGTVTFESSLVKKAGTLIFTVTRIVKDGKDCPVAGELSDSVTGP